MMISYPASADVPQSDGSPDPDNFITPSVKTILVSAFKTAQDGSQLIQVDGNVEQGDGGSPALNANGQLVGVLSLAAAVGSGAGQASFLHTANAAKDLAQQAKVSLASDAFDKRWAAAYDACISSAPGHWHDAYTQYTQIARLYPDFKGVQPYLTYTRAQAAQEPGGVSLPGWALVLIVAVVLGAGVALLLMVRRRHLRKRGAYAGYGPELAEGAPYSTAGYSLGAPESSRLQPTLPVASEQISAAVPAGSARSSTQTDPLTPTSPDLLPDSEM
jgi:hypothetical protein